MAFRVELARLLQAIVADTVSFTMERRMDPGTPERDMPFVKAEFDGRVFVPCEPVDLPAGTRVEIVLPSPEMAADQRQQWDEIAAQIESSTPRFPTVEDALRYSRKRP